MHPIEKQAIDFVKSKNLISQNDKIILSLSAGKDSMAMLNILLKLQETVNFEIGIFHLNHNMRGIESKKDELFIKNISGKLKIEYFPENHIFSKKTGLSFEEDARNIRYNLLNNICLKYNYNKIATAHNSHDNYETLLMRIFTGTGIHGLKGIAPKKENIIRPILNLQIPEILNYLKENKISWREDESNKDNKYRRNYIRNKIIPSIKKEFNSAEKSVNILSKLATENNELIDFILNEKFKNIYEKIKDDIIINNQEIIDKFLLLKHILSKIIRSEFKFDVSNSMFSEISKNIQNKKSNITLYENEKFIISRIYNIKQKKLEIKISKRETIREKNMGGWAYPISLSKNNNIYIKEIDLSIEIQLTDFNFFEKNKDNSNILFFGIEKNRDKILIRNRNDGDLIKLENGKKKIKKYFIENKLDNKIKNCVPLIIIESEIAAILTNSVSDAKNRVSVDFKIFNNQKKIIALSINKN